MHAPIRVVGGDRAEPDLQHAERHGVVFDGGAGSSLLRRMVSGTDSERARIRRMYDQGLIWTINGISTKSHKPEPMLTARSGQSILLEMYNDTTFHHPIHLHGHFFRIIARNGKPTHFREWRDTAIIAPAERVDIAFVAGKPGGWMFHCHILEHQEAGGGAFARDHLSYRPCKCIPPWARCPRHIGLVFQRLGTGARDPCPAWRSAPRHR